MNDEDAEQYSLRSDEYVESSEDIPLSPTILFSSHILYTSNHLSKLTDSARTRICLKLSLISQIRT